MRKLGVALVALAVSLAAGSPDGRAALLNFTTTIDQAQETPPSGSAGTGSGTLTLDTATGIVSFNISFSGLGSAEIAAHVHVGAPAVPGPILYGIPLGSPKVGASPALSPAEQTNMIAGNHYVNIHSVGFPLGELRGQIVAEGSPTPGILNHFQCYHIRPPATFDRSGIVLVDQFGSATVDLKKAFGLCAPADKNGEDPGASADGAHLTSYGIRKGAPFSRIRDQEVTNQFGTVRLDVVKPARLLVPTAKSLTQPPSPPAGGQLDHFQCYKVKRSRDAAKFQKVSGVQITTQFETATIDVTRPLRLCAPVDKNGEAPGADTHADHLLCYRAKGATGFGPTLVYLSNQFGQQSYQISQRREFCVPSLKNTPATTTTIQATTTSTSTSSSTTTSSTLPCECGDPTQLKFTTTIGGGNCGEILNSTGGPIMNLACQALYIGGGGSALTLPIVTSDTNLTIYNVDVCSATTLTLGPSPDPGGTSQTSLSHRTCSSEGCLYQAPLPIPNPVVAPLSTCVLNVISQDAVGTADCSTGEAQIDVPLDAVVHLAGDIFPSDMAFVDHCVGGTNAGGVCTMDSECPDGFCSVGVQSCPICIADTTSSTGSRCHGGSNTGGECNPASSDLGLPWYPTSHDCPTSSPLLGTLPIPFALTTGTATDTAVDLTAQNNVFCGFCAQIPNTYQNPAVSCESNADCTTPPFTSCKQRNDGAFAKGATRTINETGTPAGDLTDFGNHNGTLVSVFCIPPTFNGAIDSSADLPGPGAVAMPGQLMLMSPGGAFLDDVRR